MNAIMKITVAFFILALFDLTPALALETTIAQWTFETTIPTTAGPVSADVGSGTGMGLHSADAAYSNPSGNGSNESWSANKWSVGDYWQFSVSTLGFNGIQISYDQYGSGTGPRDFDVEYSTDGIGFTTITSYALSAATTWDSRSFDLSSIAGLNNSSTVYFRLVDTSTASANDGTVGTSGTDRIDNFTITGTQIPLNVPASTPGLAGLVCILGLLTVWRINNASNLARQKNI